MNGDAIDGYNVYVDDGYGGPYSLVFEGKNQANTYQYTITELECGLPYSVKVTAINSAGEGSSVVQSIYLGSPPSAPLYPKLISVTPQSNLVLSWQAPIDDGCLPITSYVL